ncbi:MAG: hypothetical protein QOH71_1733 [Blastocatellia bacterium]|jgi:hypothetical protein|nr:hypothetical protein [Blastocatellia bacterium]
MSFEPNTPGRAEWTMYATILLMAMVLTAIATALPISQWIRSWLKPDVVAEQKVPGAVPKPDGVRPSLKRNICGRWQSQTSQKYYNVICESDGLFDVYEVSETGLVKAGSGTVADDGAVEAELVSPSKNRRGHWKLKLSSDGQTMHGPWYGDDPRESGQLTFEKK